MARFEVYFNIPSPYRLHMLNALWRELSRRGVDFHVHFMSKGHSNRPKSWLNPLIEFPHTYWRDYGVGEHHFNPGLILHSVFTYADWMLIGSPYDTFTGIGVVLFGRSPNKIAGAEGNTKTPGKLSGFIGWFKRFIYSRCRFASVPGHDAIAYFQLHQALTSIKMPHPVILPNLVDETRFKTRDEWPGAIISRHREKVIGNNSRLKICLIPARLDVVKGLVPFLENLNPEWVQDWRIVILGQGPLKQTILDVSKDRVLAEHVIILDYVAYNEMPLYYASADLLLLPSLYDPNPLSVPEALFSGLPIALSDQAGNVEEGVTEGKDGNGWRLPVKDPNRFPSVLKDVFSSDLALLAQKGNVSLRENSKFWATDLSVKKYLDELGACREWEGK